MGRTSHLSAACQSRKAVDSGSQHGPLRLLTKTLCPYVCVVQQLISWDTIRRGGVCVPQTVRICSCSLTSHSSALCPVSLPPPHPLPLLSLHSPSPPLLSSAHLAPCLLPLHWCISPLLAASVSLSLVSSSLGCLECETCSACVSLTRPRSGNVTRSIWCQGH